jgi:adenine deaminase
VTACLRPQSEGTLKKERIEMRKPIWTLSLLFVLTAGSSAQTTSDVTVIRAARMLDVVRGEIIRDAVVVLEGDRIASVNPGGLPEDATIVDLGDVS